MAARIIPAAPDLSGWAADPGCTGLITGDGSEGEAAPQVSAIIAASPPLVPRAPVPERLPRGNLARLRAALATAGLWLHEDDVERWLAVLRRLYDPYVNALAERLLFTLPPWLPSTASDDW